MTVRAAFVLITMIIIVRLAFFFVPQYLEAAHTAHGLKADIPLPVGGASWCAPLPDTAPDYMLEAAAALREGAPRPGRAAFAASPGCAGRKPGQGPSKLRNLVARCHVRLPWLLSQLEAPSEAAVLRSAKRLWLGEAEVKGGSAEAARGCGASGPLLLFPDTSVLLAMLGAPRRAVAPCLLSLAALGRQAAGVPGPASDRVHVVVSDSVMKQLDGMKKDPILGMAVRRFFSTDLDTLGPAGEEGDEKRREGGWVGWGGTRDFHSRTACESCSSSTVFSSFHLT